MSTEKFKVILTIVRVVFHVTQEVNQMKMIKVKTILFILLFLAIGIFNSFAQEGELLAGAITYIAGSNIYIRTKSTSNIEIGDTIFQSTNNNTLLPILLVKHKSSITCLCSPLVDDEFKVGDKIVLLNKSKKDTTAPKEIGQVEKDVSEEVISNKIQNNEEKGTQKGDTYGRLGVSYYTNSSNTIASTKSKLRYTGIINASNINNSKYSFEAYTLYTSRYEDEKPQNVNLNESLKIYNLAAGYDINPKTNVWLGRKINPQIANMGAIDGLQFNKTMKKFKTGAVMGFRPDYEDYGFNSDLLEFAAYISHQDKFKGRNYQTSAAFVNQMNKGNTDRRFIYIQHSNTIVKNLSLFTSSEIDLYSLQDNQPSNDISLTSLYLSLRYRMFRNLSLSTSYDTRKNVIYYETFKNFTDQLIDQAARQGFNARVNYRPIKYLTVNVSAGTRFREGDQTKTKNLYAYLNYSQLPWIYSSLSVSSNIIHYNYLNARIFGFRISKDFLNGKLNPSVSYRNTNYKYLNTNTYIKQNIAELNLSYRLPHKISISIDVESTFQEQKTFNRVYFNVYKRF